MKYNIVEKIFTYNNFEYKLFGIPNEHIFKQIPWYEHELL